MISFSKELIDKPIGVLPHPFKVMLEKDNQGIILPSRPVLYRDELNNLSQIFGRDISKTEARPLEVIVVENLTNEEQFQLCSSLHKKHQELVQEFSQKSFNIYKGDCLDFLGLLPENSIDSIVTDPPYGISIMKNKWDAEVPDIEIWQECFRILKPGGHLLSFSGSRTYHINATNIENSGFDIRDQIMWIYGTGLTRSQDIGKKLKEKRETGGNKLSVSECSKWDGWATVLKPAHEPIVVARKPLSEKNIADNVLMWGTGGINIEESKIIDPKVKKCKKNKGRYPTNVILKEPPEEKWAPYFYCPKPTKKEKNLGLDLLSEKVLSTVNEEGLKNESKWGNTLIKNNHPTVKPIELMEYLIKLVTPVGGTTLDPFMGSGTSGIAANKNDIKFIGIEREDEYFKIAQDRLEEIHKNAA